MKKKSRKPKKAETQAPEVENLEAGADAIEAQEADEMPVEAAETPIEDAPEEAAMGESTPEADQPEPTPAGEVTDESPEEPTESGECDEAVVLPEGVTARPLVEIIEAILFASQKPVSAKELRNIFKGAAESNDPAAQVYAKIKEPQLRESLSELAFSLQERGSTYEVRETAAGWQLMTRPDFSPWLRQLFPENRPARLSAPALETLAIIAYRQPITRADIEAVRGVAVDGVMQTLLDRGLIRIGGRAEIAGRPLLYETTQFFMEHFGLRDLDELPNAAELRKIALPTAEVPPAETPAAESTPEATSASEPALETTAETVVTEAASEPAIEATVETGETPPDEPLPAPEPDAVFAAEEVSAESVPDQFVEEPPVPEDAPLSEEDKQESSPS